MIFFSPQKRKIALLKKYFNNQSEVMFAFLFGSQAKNRQAGYSDWDIAVYFKPKSAVLEWEEPAIENSQEERVWNDCIDILKTDNVDLVVLNRAGSNISDTALSGIPLVIKDRALWLNFMLTVSQDAENYRGFAKDFYEISQRSRSLSEKDGQILRRTIQFLEIQITLYSDFKILTYDEYQNELHKRNDVERWIENIINAAIDISKTILASRKKQVPDTYREVMRQAASELKLSRETIEKFERWAKLRNILAHEYLDIRWQRISDFIQNSEIYFQQLSAAAKRCVE